MVADEAGNVELWTFKDNVLNDWILIGSTVFPGEHILGAAWFHNGKKVFKLFLLISYNYFFNKLFDSYRNNDFFYSFLRLAWCRRKKIVFITARNSIICCLHHR